MSNARLIIDREGDGPSEVTLGAETTLGRNASSTVAIDSRDVSRNHALIVAEADGGYLLSDVGSANGTFLNDRRVIAPAHLQTGDVIRVGSAAMTFVDDSRPAAKRRPSALAEATTLKAEETARVLIGSSPAMTEVFALIDKAGASTIPVLIEGETGTGKELVARAVHEASGRAGGVFMAVNCAAMPETLLESELFGHRRGAFTGAAQDRDGLFAAAAGGTVFLDEIGEMPIGMQPKLLRVLQEGEVTRVGDNRPQKVDFRLVSATNRNLLGEVEAGRFRQDLYYRIGAFPIELPPLRARREDIPAIASMLLAAASRGQGKRIVAIDRSAMAALTSFDWPGNVRELQNEIDRAVTMAEAGDSVELGHLSPRLTGGASSTHAGSEPTRPEGTEGGADLRSRTDAFERTEILAALERSDGNKSHAAKELGITYQGLLKKMRRLGMVD